MDTIAFNRIPKPYDTQDKKEYDRLLATLTEAVDAGDLGTVGRISTRSAVLNRKLRPQRDFGAVLRACREVEGLGLVTAHSGTVSGILLAEDDPDGPGKTRQATQLLGRLTGSVTVHRSLPSPPRRLTEARRATAPRLHDLGAGAGTGPRRPRPGAGGVPAR